jgi:mycofactocin precursor
VFAGELRGEVVMVDPTSADAALSTVPSDEDRPSGAGDGELAEDRELVEEELLVEDVSIDGMCGVY